VAKDAAVTANKVARHSIKVSGHARKALRHALGALHDARVESEGLSQDQKISLKLAEARLREATKKANHGDLKTFKDDKDLQKEAMQKDLDKMPLSKDGGEEEQVKSGKESESSDSKTNEKQSDDVDQKQEKEASSLKDEQAKDGEKAGSGSFGAKEDEQVTPVQEKGIDIDTQMPYGDLEPFGREDTAQELTENSVRESDEMVDQLERAEVAEEKRAVFRALTRLRGAAITSYDGVARSQTGNIDEYNKIHKWRKTHPIHHLADEESDISKWAFPDNADFLQKGKKPKL